MYGEGPPCYRCKPELKECNYPFFTLYNYCQDQVIMGPSGAVALDMKAVNQGMDDHLIAQDERILFSSKVRKIANIIFELHHKEAEKRRKAATKKK